MGRDVLISTMGAQHPLERECRHNFSLQTLVTTTGEQTATEGTARPLSTQRFLSVPPSAAPKGVKPNKRSVHVYFRGEGVSGPRSRDGADGSVSTGGCPDSCGTGSLGKGKKKYGVRNSSSPRSKKTLPTLTILEMSS